MLRRLREFFMTEYEQGASRLGLRDKGFTEYYTTTHGSASSSFLFYDSCTLCYARLRIGIGKKDNKTVSYCFRCEKIFKKFGSNSDGGLSVDNTGQGNGDNGNVVNLYPSDSPKAS